MGYNQQSTKSHIYGEKITKKESRALIKSGRAVLRNELRVTSSDRMFDFYIVDNIKLLVVLAIVGSSVLYHSHQHFLNMLEEVAKKDRLLFPGKNADEWRLPEEHIRSDQVEFEALIEQSPSLLADKLGLSIAELDFSKKSLSNISKRLVQIIKDEDRFYIGLEYLDLLIAYFGESIRRRVDGRWLIENINGKITRLEVSKNEYSYYPHWYLIDVFFVEMGKLDLGGRLEVEVPAKI